VRPIKVDPGRRLSAATPLPAPPGVDLGQGHATRAYRGSHNLRAVQKLLGHASVLSTEIYTIVAGDEIRAAAAHAW
jgi:integrase